MKPDINNIKDSISSYIQQHFSGNKKVQDLNDKTPLLGSGILDSISTMQLVVHLEKTFNFEFEAHEVDKDNFQNIAILADFILKKL